LAIEGTLTLWTSRWHWKIWEFLLNAQHQTEKARQAFEEALKIYKAYAKQNPEQFSSDVKRVEKLLQELQR